MSKLTELWGGLSGWKQKGLAVAVFVLAVVGAWNNMVIQLGHGSCTKTAEEILAGAECPTDLTIALPNFTEFLQ